MISETKLDLWVKNNLNVLLIGEKGVGKSSIIINTFKRHNIKYLYFSAPTIDPWVDLIGIPKEVESNGQKYIDLIRPKFVVDDDIEAFVFDELNRCKSRVSNAVLELIQFKSINGKKFPKLRMVWAAINPDTKDQDGELNYNVEKLDPALEDRFQVKVEMPYVLDEAFFVKKYGKAMAFAAINWWKSLDQKVKNNVSPRRVEYALDMFKVRVDLRDILPASANIALLTKELNTGSYFGRLEEIFKNKDINAAKSFINDEECYNAVYERVLARPDLINFFFPHIKEEKMFALLKDNRFSGAITKNQDIFKHHIDAILQSSAGSSVVDSMKKILAPKNINSTSTPTLPTPKTAPTGSNAWLIASTIGGYDVLINNITRLTSFELAKRYTDLVKLEKNAITPESQLSMSANFIVHESSLFNSMFGVSFNDSTHNRKVYYTAYFDIVNALEQIPGALANDKVNVLISVLNHYTDTITSRTYMYLNEGSAIFFMYIIRKLKELLDSVAVDNSKLIPLNNIDAPTVRFLKHIQQKKDIFPSVFS